MSMKLSDLITSIRACKTTAEERALTNKEKAAIRQSFTTNQHEFRPRNIAKLLFINLLGYETDFGQMECLTLISRPSFIEKRIGYLGITHLFSEKSEILMMSTNRIRTDFDSSNHYLQAVAIHTFSQIATDDMCKELGPSLAELIGKGHSYISKKA